MQKEWENMEITIKHPDAVSYLYLPLVNEAVMSNITPDGHGDNKISQESFFLEPVSAENLHSSMATRNFWCKIEGYGLWSVFGYSVNQKYNCKEEEAKLRIGPFWQEVRRKNRKAEISSSILSFCPAGKEKVEIMIVTLKNEGEMPRSILPVAAMPIYGRGADRLRDHRHVSSLLNRIRVSEYGVTTIPSMSFDETGHHKNRISYSVFGMDEEGNGPEGAIPLVEEFIGEGGSYLWPKSLEEKPFRMKQSGYQEDGYEAMGALCFREIVLQPGASRSYVVLMSYDMEGTEYLHLPKARSAFAKMKQFWKEQKTISCRTADKQFDTWMDWISIQPHLRRIYGCSFLPYHDYGRGGRGWRDLWQDCLALILMQPETVRQNLADFFSGVRIDGTNATIIGSRPGEFIADRNAIVRVWMDHAYWPFRTVFLYLQQTGDMNFLFEKRPYFKDQIIIRGEQTDPSFLSGSVGKTVTKENRVYEGTLLEHLLLQHLTQFYDVGEHNHMRLHGADWNDALDMAEQRGESVAFTAAYGGNLADLADLLHRLAEKGKQTIEVFEEFGILLQTEESLYDDPEKKQNVLRQYCRMCQPSLSGKRITLNLDTLACTLKRKSDWIRRHIQDQEIVGDGKGKIWFNGYYDNDGMQVEGKDGSVIRMMLTSQVFAILSKTAEDDQVEKICKAVDCYLYDEAAGGYRLNTDFKENRMNLGRMFGFAYGHKENGAVFSHMTVMFAYALYSRGFVKEGYHALKALKQASMDFKKSRIYPSIPEYFNSKGRGMYTYLTGAGSWMVLTVLTQMFGVQGDNGNLRFVPKLLKEQFDKDGCAAIDCSFAGRKLQICYVNKNGKEIGDYEVEEVAVNGIPYHVGKDPVLFREDIEALSEYQVHVIRIILN